MIVFVTEYFFLEGRPNISRSFVSVRKRVFMYSTSSFKESVADGRGFLACNVFISFLIDDRFRLSSIFRYFTIVRGDSTMQSRSNYKLHFVFLGLTWIVCSINDHAFNSRSYKLMITKFSPN